MCSSSSSTTATDCSHFHVGSLRSRHHLPLVLPVVVHIFTHSSNVSHIAGHTIQLLFIFAFVSLIFYFLGVPISLLSPHIFLFTFLHKLCYNAIIYFLHWPLVHLVLRFSTFIVSLISLFSHDVFLWICMPICASSFLPFAVFSCWVSIPGFPSHVAWLVILPLWMSPLALGGLLLSHALLASFPVIASWLHSSAYFHIYSFIVLYHTSKLHELPNFLELVAEHLHNSIRCSIQAQISVFDTDILIPLFSTASLHISSSSSSSVIISTQLTVIHKDHLPWGLLS